MALDTRYRLEVAYKKEVAWIGGKELRKKITHPSVGFAWGACVRLPELFQGLVVDDANGVTWDSAPAAQLAKCIKFVDAETDTSYSIVVEGIYANQTLGGNLTSPTPLPRIVADDLPSPKYKFGERIPGEHVDTGFGMDVYDANEYFRDGRSGDGIQFHTPIGSEYSEDEKPNTLPWCYRRPYATQMGSRCPTSTIFFAKNASKAQGRRKEKGVNTRSIGRPGKLRREIEFPAASSSSRKAKRRATWPRFSIILLARRTRGTTR